MALMRALEPNQLEVAGWAAVFPQNGDLAVREALGELLDHRRRQAANTRAHRYQEYVGVRGYPAGTPPESVRSFLARHGADPGPVNPDRVPYYLLLVADPESIPFRFQCELDVEYAVGRLWFGTDGKPDLDAFAHYARTVVAAETGGLRRPGRVVFFGVENEDDPVSSVIARQLLAPLMEHASKDAASGPLRWEVGQIIEKEATKARLAAILGGDAPALLFCSGHGVGFPDGDALQRPYQGALLCGDWPGPRQWSGPIPAEFYFAATDVPNEADLGGLIAFLYASDSAGTGPPSPRSFVAALPQRLLGHPGGAALAVVGYVGRLWYDLSSDSPVRARQREVFQSAVQRLLRGDRVGPALEFCGQRHAALASELLAAASSGGPDDVRRKAPALWPALNEARSLVVLGDPAVRLPQPDPMQRTA
jgi:hypothetical protein